MPSSFEDEEIEAVFGDRFGLALCLVILAFATFLYSMPYRLPLYAQATWSESVAKPDTKQEVDPREFFRVMTWLSSQSPLDSFGPFVLTQAVVRIFVLGLICLGSLHLVSRFPDTWVSDTWVGWVAGKMLVVGICFLAIWYGGGGIDWLFRILDAADKLLRPVPILGWIWAVFFGIIGLLFGIVLGVLTLFLWLVHIVAGFCAYLLSFIVPLSVSVTIVTLLAPAFFFLGGTGQFISASRSKCSG